MSTRIEEFEIKEDTKPVWMNCIVSHKCEGTQAHLVMKFHVKGVGITYRYKCCTCGGVYHVQAGGSF